jgi:hypothetical protein
MQILCRFYFIYTALRSEAVAEILAELLGQLLLPIVHRSQATKEDNQP